MLLLIHKSDWLIIIKSLDSTGLSGVEMANQGCVGALCESERNSGAHLRDGPVRAVWQGW